MGGLVGRWMDLWRNVEEDKRRVEGWMDESYEGGWMLDHGWEKDGCTHAQ